MGLDSNHCSKAIGSKRMAKSQGGPAVKYKPPQPQSYSAETAALITQLKERIKRLEEAGNELYDGWRSQRNNMDKYLEAWNKAKEAKL